MAAATSGVGVRQWCTVQMPNSFGPMGYGMPSGGPTMQMPPAMAFPKGSAAFMPPPQQQRMEVTVPVPEARVSVSSLLLDLHCSGMHHPKDVAVNTNRATRMNTGGPGYVLISNPPQASCSVRWTCPKRFQVWSGCGMRMKGSLRVC